MGKGEVGQTGRRAVGQWILVGAVLVSERGAAEVFPGLKSGAIWPHGHEVRLCGLELANLCGKHLAPVLS